MNDCIFINKECNKCPFMVINTIILSNDTLLKSVTALYISRIVFIWMNIFNLLITSCMQERVLRVDFARFNLMFVLYVHRSGAHDGKVPEGL